MVEYTWTIGFRVTLPPDVGDEVLLGKADELMGALVAFQESTGLTIDPDVSADAVKREVYVSLLAVAPSKRGSRRRAESILFEAITKTGGVPVGLESEGAPGPGAEWQQHLLAVG
jgi:hypothetical protein